MKRYVVEKSGDGRGGLYMDSEGRPTLLRMFESDRFEDAAHYVHSNGGEVIDLDRRMCWIPNVGWESCDSYLSMLGR